MIRSKHVSPRIDVSKHMVLAVGVVLLLVVVAAPVVGQGVTTTIVLDDDPPPDGNGVFSSFSRPTVNDAGQVAFSAHLESTLFGINDDGIFRSDGGALVRIVREGHPGPKDVGSLSTFGSPALNDSGQVAFESSLINAPYDSGIFRSSGDDVSLIALMGSPTPDGNGLFAQFDEPVINASGQVAFWAGLDNTIGAASDDVGIFRGSGKGVTQILREGHTSPGGNEVFSNEIFSPALNDAGQVAFSANLVFTDGMNDDNEGVFRSDGTTLTQIVRKGQAAPDGNGTFSVFGDPTINDAGQVMFRGGFVGTAGMDDDNRGIFLGDGQEIITVAREGQPLEGSTIPTINILSILDGADRGGRSGLNQYGQVAYWTTLVNGKEGIFLFTPDLHWRTTQNGNWDDSANWTVGIDPAHVHPVWIDPADNVVVTGPAGATTVKSLAIGGGAGQATLRLEPVDALTVTEQLTVDTDSTLAIEIAGLAPGTQFGRIDILGTADLGGTLDINVVNAFLPGLPDPLDGGNGDSFTVLMAGSINGAFDTVAGLDYDNSIETGHLFEFDQSLTDITLTTFQAAYGDGNMDRSVDSFDLFAILAFGKFNHPELGPANWLEGDYNGDDLVDSTDLFLILASGKYNHGPYTTSTPPATVQAVPEPPALALAAIALLGLLACIGRKRADCCSSNL